MLTTLTNRRKITSTLFVTHRWKYNHEHAAIIHRKVGYLILCSKGCIHWKLWDNHHCLNNESYSSTHTDTHGTHVVSHIAHTLHTHCHTLHTYTHCHTAHTHTRHTNTHTTHTTHTCTHKYMYHMCDVSWAAVSLLSEVHDFTFKKSRLMHRAYSFTLYNNVHV